MDKICPAIVGRNNLNTSVTHDPIFFKDSLTIYPPATTAMTDCSVNLSYHLRPPELRQTQTIYFLIIKTQNGTVPIV